MSPRVTTDQMADMLRETRGMIAVAARRLNVDRTTIYTRLKRSARLREVLTEAREYTTDVAELKLFKAINDGDSWAIQFYLKTQAKNRGYVERTEVVQTEPTDIIVDLVTVPNDDNDGDD